MEKSDNDNELDDLNPFEDGPQPNLEEPAALKPKNEVQLSEDASGLPSVIGSISGAQQIVDNMNRLVGPDDRKRELKVTEVHLKTAKLKKDHPLMPTEDLIEFWYLVMRTGARPMEKDVYLIPFTDNVKVGQSWVSKIRGQTVFDYKFLLKCAATNPLFDSIQEDYKFVEEPGPDGKKLHRLQAIATIYKKDSERPTIAKAYFDEFCKRGKNGPVGLWKTHAGIMTSKCAVARACRFAFPQAMGGMYTEEEFDRIVDAARVLNQPDEHSLQSMKKVNEHYAQLGAKKDEEKTDGETKEETKKESGKKASKKGSSSRGAKSANP